MVGRNAAVGDDERMLKTAQPATDLVIICGFLPEFGGCDGGGPLALGCSRTT